MIDKKKWRDHLELSNPDHNLNGSIFQQNHPDLYRELRENYQHELIYAQVVPYSVPLLGYPMIGGRN